MNNQNLFSDSFSISESDHSFIFNDNLNKSQNIFDNINELSVFENENENVKKFEKSIWECNNNHNEIEPIRKTENNKKEIELEEHSKKNSLKQKINNQTLVLLSNVMEQTGFEQQKYFIDFGDVKINTTNRWNIILHCDIVKIINWQLTQEKTLLEKKFTRDGDEFIQNHTLDIDAFSINYTHGKVNPNKEKSLILSFFPTAIGKYYKKITINFGKHKILFNIEGNGISRKIINLLNESKIDKQNRIINNINVNNSDDKYLILNEDNTDNTFSINKGNIFILLLILN